ncbi:hypothetical protein GOODEAATRI_024765, partial [Goodea atripinnis]
FTEARFLLVGSKLELEFLPSAPAINSNHTQYLSSLVVFATRLNRPAAYLLVIRLLTYVLRT